ncbi:proteasome subunit alpha type-5-like [Ctenocephalides felis]|uniref:proteasome subunit alpha type-5-like n=1 Tax=Ctenocephalides felis TaxID=7515 RepID=UPI000E6E20EB|nr:proteasome subunit alpha type-5-like [Ctenocephalides felis]
MFLRRTEYDRGVNTFSPEGRLFQVEYAVEAIKLGSTAIGIKTHEGVILAVEKNERSPLVVPGSIQKIIEIDDHIGCVFSGHVADSRTLLDRARLECQSHWFVYNEKMSVESCTQAVSNLAIQFGCGDDEGPSICRPFGVALLFAGIDERGPQLYHLDPSGTFIQFEAKAIGAGSEVADQILQDTYYKDINIEDATFIALTILKQDMNREMEPIDVDLMVMETSKKFTMYTEKEISEVISKTLHC